MNKFLVILLLILEARELIQNYIFDGLVKPETNYSFNGKLIGTVILFTYLYFCHFFDPLLTSN